MVRKWFPDADNAGTVTSLGVEDTDICLGLVQAGPRSLGHRTEGDA